jgi:crotonobetainyl-CoA:carnitine CoA-transferase CaiB-like acyl-CoA transferase
VQLLFDEPWGRFCAAVGRPDLMEMYDGADDGAATDTSVARELTTLFASRPRDEWMRLFLERGVWALPVYTYGDLVADEHFLSRDQVYRPEGVDAVRLLGTPIKVHGQEFRPPLAPHLGEHTDAVLGDRLAIDARDARALRGRGITG